MSDRLTCQRALFSLPPDVCYLNSAYMGPLPRPVQQAGHDAIARRAATVDLVPADFFAPAERVRAQCASLVGASPERVALIPSVAAGMAIARTNLAVPRGATLVLLAEQFPSTAHPCRRWAEEGARLRVVPRCDDWNAALLEAIDPDVAGVVVEQAHWTDGTLFDLVAVGERCRAVGAWLVIDATQTVGAMPLDVGAVRPDLLLVHAYKSMLSNYGLGFAVVGERLAGGRAVEESWLTREGSEDFSRLVDYTDAYAPGARRFDTSTRANPMLIDMLEAACTLLLQWRPQRIREYLLEIEAPFVARLREAGFRIADAPRRAANVFGVGLPPGLEARAVRDALAARRIHVSVRGDAVRVSPHVCNDEADLMRLADALIALPTG